MGPLWAIVSLVALSSSGAVVLEPTRHIRGTGPFARWLIETTLHHSPTANRLAERIEASDVIVYVEVIPLPSRNAQTVLLTATRYVRYLKVSIHSGHAPGELMELFGHELQHVVEIAESPHVRDRAGMRELYRRIGLGGREQDQFETLLARTMGQRVRRESRSARR
ncbi:MAG TPA: hypothetical protein VK886_04505 [Vicinamibacterales bacterium]|nr:hypothetical protein [Vicinamibacterales bacterium]